MGKDINYGEAIELIKEVSKETHDIGILIDRGRGDDPDIRRIYSIVKNGEDNNPLAYISEEIFDKLIANNKSMKKIR